MTAEEKLSRLMSLLFSDPIPLDNNPNHLIDYSVDGNLEAVINDLEQNPESVYGCLVTLNKLLVKLVEAKQCLFED